MAEEPEIIDEPLMARVHRLASPSFRTSYPELHDKNLIPRDALGAMEQAWNLGRLAVRPVNFYRLRNVYVCAEGLVFDEALRLYRSTLAQHPPAYVARALRQLRERRTNGSIPSHEGPHLLCKKIGAFNFGHWLIEMLPRAALARAHLGIADLCHVVHAVEDPMRTVLRDSFALLGTPRKAVLETTNDPHFFSELIIVDGLSEHGQYMSPLCIQALEALTAMVRSGSSERLFITRQSARWRRLRNEDRLHDMAQRAGYSLADPGAMSLVQQIMVFKGAKRIAGVSGAGMTNTAFCPPGAAVRLLVPASMPDTFFWFISQLRGHSYAEQRCPEIGQPPVDNVIHPNWNCDITVPDEAFRRFLEI